MRATYIDRKRKSALDARHGAASLEVNNAIRRVSTATTTRIETDTSTDRQTSAGAAATPYTDTQRSARRG